MNIHPSQLKGKVIKDCYMSDEDEITIEFTDGTKITFEAIAISERGSLSGEIYLNLEYT